MSLMETGELGPVHKCHRLPVTFAFPVRQGLQDGVGVKSGFGQCTRDGTCPLWSKTDQQCLDVIARQLEISYYKNNGA